MAFIFGRNTSAPFGQMAEAAAELARHPTESLYRAIGKNLLHDHRVCDARAEHFYYFTSQPRSSADLLQALDTYVKAWINTEAPEKTYLSDAHNAVNIIDANRRQSFQLGHVLNISAHLHRIAQSQIVTASQKSDLRGAEAQLLDPGLAEEGKSQLMTRLLKAACRVNGNRPQWSARWIHLKHHVIPADPGTWNAAVGVFRDRSCLQMVLRYSARSLRLVRPTQLDIGLYAFHFPSPPHFDKATGGVAMSLSDAGPRGRLPLVSEYIHPPIQFTPEHWVRAGGWMDRHPGDRLEDIDIGLFRDQHIDRLSRLRSTRSSPAAIAWLDAIK